MTIYDTPLIRETDVATTDLLSIPEIPVYYPTWEEFRDFKKFIYKIEKRGAHHIGLCKVVPPRGWVARKLGYSDLDILIIPNPVKQSTFGGNGVFLQENKEEKSINYKTFRQFNFNDKKITPPYKDWDDLEKKYWRTFHYSTPLYGANISGTITDSSQKVWNIAFLPSILSDVLNNKKIGGVNTPYLYFGSWQSTFGWHLEDMDLYSINYLHFGMPKFWYVIPPPFAKRFEDLVKSLYEKYYKKCPEFLRHKTVIINPEYLHKHGIPTRKIIQEENDFMITFPFGYHCGFNTGLNIAESTNFASARWIEFGNQASLCKCFPNSVKINMKKFANIVEPPLWKVPLNINDDVSHPIDLYKRIFRGDKIRKKEDIFSNLSVVRLNNNEISRRFPKMVCYGSETAMYSSDEDTEAAIEEDVSEKGE